MSAHELSVQIIGASETEFSSKMFLIANKFWAIDLNLGEVVMNSAMGTSAFLALFQVFNISMLFVAAHRSKTAKRLSGDCASSNPPSPLHNKASQIGTLFIYLHDRGKQSSKKEAHAHSR